MKNLLLILFLLTTLAAKAQETYSITGTVTDEKGETLPGATVFIANTQKATTANSEGKFILNGLQPGTYELAVNMIGFNSHIQTFSINQKPVNITVKLSVSVTALNAVTINGYDPNRRNYMAQFVQNFIGSSPNAGQCKILNPEVISFQFNKENNVLTANASDLVIVENDALGYTIKYLLTEFNIDWKNKIAVNVGYPYFEELKGTWVQQRQWENNRKIAYLGSSRHFFKAVATNTAEAEGYYVYRSPAKPTSGGFLSLPKTEPLNINSVFITENKSKLLLTHSNDSTGSALCIVYTQKPVPVPLSFPDKQISTIYPLADSIRIDTDGRVLPTKNFLTTGYWARGKMANLTPLEYFFDPKPAQKAAVITETVEGTYSITGTVTDEKGETLPGTTVFIANTQKATSADSEGKFILDGLQPGTYDLDVKMLGFNLYTEQVAIGNAPVVLNVVLKTNSILLKTVNISGMSKETRERLLKSITQSLLGYSANADKCKLLNPDAVNINFKVEKTAGAIPQGITEASSDEFLIIENKALGYNLHYLLTGYTEYFGTLTYIGTLYFEEMKGSKSEEERWKKNRKATYEGSITHFFRAAFSNTLDEQKFSIYKLPYIRHYQSKVKAQDLQPYKIPAHMFTEVDANTRLLNLSSLREDTTQLYVVYTGKNVPSDFTTSVANITMPFKIPAKLQQVSIIRPMDNTIIVEKNGNISPPDGILRLGYWSWCRAADFLPSDYVVPF